MINTLEEFKKQHLENYRQAIMEIIRNNTDVLVNEDIMSLLRKPPLDSMDLIKSKYLDLAKKNKVVLDTVKLDRMLDSYRNEVVKCCEIVKEIRVSSLESIVDKFEFIKDTDVIKINKKDFNDINKKLKKSMKDQIQLSIEKKIIDNVDCVFTSDIEETVKKKICSELIKFVKGSYQRQLFDNFDFKILVKDTTLANGIKEQGERHLFTLNNSRIFKQES